MKTHDLKKKLNGRTKTWIEGYIFNQKVVYNTQIIKKKSLGVKFYLIQTSL